MTQSHQAWRHTWVLLALVVIIAGIVATLALVTAAGTIGDDSTPTPSPTPSPRPTPTPTPSPSPSPSPTPEPPETAYQLVYREFGQAEDVIWRALPADPEQRVELARIPHREGFGIKPSLSPDGTMLAYLTLPETAISAQSSQAEAFVMDLATKATEKVASDVDFTFPPLWSLDGRLLYMRQLAGPEFLAADVIIVRAIVPPVGQVTPFPTPTPAPPETPVPTRPAFEEAFGDTIARVLSFIPVGWDRDEESLLFVQIRGGTQQGSLLGSFRPATTEALAEAWDEYLELLAQLASETPTPPPGQTPTPTPSPAGTPTPSPTPFWETDLVVTLSEQITFDYDLSLSRNKLLHLAQEFTDEGLIANRAYWTDIPARSVQPVGPGELPAGHHLRPLWYADSDRVTLGVLPFDGGNGRLVILNRDGSGVQDLATAGSGFDEPRAWAPDGSWLAVAHSENASLTNRGKGSLVVVAKTGLRLTVIEGVDNATQDSVLGWVKVTE